MTYKAIIGIAVIAGLLQLFRIKNNFALLITVGHLLGIGLPIFSEKVWTNVGVFTLGLSMIMALIYGSTREGFGWMKRTIISLPSFLVLLMLVFQFQDWPGAGIIGSIMLVPIIAFGSLIFQGVKNFRDELGFITITTAVAAIDFLLRFDLINK